MVVTLLVFGSFLWTVAVPAVLDAFGVDCLAEGVRTPPAIFTKAGLVTAAGDNGSKTICSRVAPFRLVFSSDTFEMSAAAMDEGTGGGVGFKLRYFQTTC